MHIPLPSPLLCALSLHGTRCLVVGAGPVGRRRARALVEQGAHVKLVAPGPPDTTEWAQKLAPHITWYARPFEQHDTHDIALCVACTDSPDLNDTILQHALHTTPLTASATQSPHASLSFLASHSRGPLTIAVRAGLSSPRLAKLLTTRIAQTLSPEWTCAASIAHTLRPILPKLLPTQHQRARFWSTWITPTLWTLLSHPTKLLLHTRRALSTPLSEEQDATLRTALLNLPLYTTHNHSAKRTLLLSSFGPFPGVPINPSSTAAKQTQNTLLSTPATHSLDDLQHIELPTHYDEAWHLLSNSIEAIQNDPERTLCGVLSLGVSGSIDRVHLERTAVNVRAAHKPDASGRSFDTVSTLVPFGPHGLSSTLGVDELCAKVRLLGLPIAVSEHAGTYLCNEVFYKLTLWRNQQSSPIPTGFIHIPPAHISAPHTTAHVLSEAICALFPPQTQHTNIS